VLVILDTNVLVSAVVSPSSTCARLLRAVRQREVACAVSPSLLGELEAALARPKLRRYVTVGEASRYSAELRTLCDVVREPAVAVGVTRDPKDDYLVALALAVGADLLVSGDRDLIEAGLVKPVVVTPRDAVERLRL
jgi:uncharacterized protein